MHQIGMSSKRRYMLRKYGEPKLPIKQEKKSKQAITEEDYPELVVKIHSQNIVFNWNEPYKNYESNETIGTGFFINEQGYLLTASHVIEDSIKVYATIPKIGKKSFDIEVLSMYPYEDISLLKIKGYQNRKYFRFGDSDKIKSGNKVIALGYPHGQDRLKQSAGIISGLQDGNIQTDTPINPGNSGGPLVDEDNEVVGINFSSLSTMFAENIGYAIPINKFKLLKNKMFDKENKLIMNPILGGLFNNATEDMLDYHNNKNCPSGYYINTVFDNGPLDKAGIQKGDILCNVNGYKIDNYGEIEVDWNNEKINMSDVIDRHLVGDKIKLLILREKNIFQKTLVLEPSDFFKIRWQYPKFESIDYQVFGGIVVMQLSLDHIKENADKYYKYTKLKNRLEEVLTISYIYPGSYMKKMEVLATNDVLKKVNNIEVSTLDEYRTALRKPIKNDKAYYMSFEAEDRTKIMIGLDKLLEEEQFLSKEYKYEIDKKLIDELAGYS